MNVKDLTEEQIMDLAKWANFLKRQEVIEQ